MARAQRQSGDVPSRSDDSNLMSPRSDETGSDDTSATPQAAGDTTSASPDRERVAMRAYELYLSRGAGDGRALDDWLTAERELSGTDPDRNE